METDVEPRYDLSVYVAANGRGTFVSHDHCGGGGGGGGGGGRR